MIWVVDDCRKQSVFNSVDHIVKQIGAGRQITLPDWSSYESVYSVFIRGWCQPPPSGCCIKPTGEDGGSCDFVNGTFQEAMGLEDADCVQGSRTCSQQFCYVFYNLFSIVLLMMMRVSHLCGAEQSVGWMYLQCLCLKCLKQMVMRTFVKSLFLIERIAIDILLFIDRTIRLALCNPSRFCLTIYS